MDHNGLEGVLGDGGVIVYRGADGSEAWRFSLQAFEAQTPEGPEALHALLREQGKLADVKFALGLSLGDQFAENI